MDSKIIRKVIIIYVCVALLMPFILTRPAIIPELNFNTTGAIGDTIGGITSPFFNILAAILIFLTYEKQNEAFQNQKNNHETQIELLTSELKMQQYHFVFDKMMSKFSELKIHNSPIKLIHKITFEYSTDETNRDKLSLNQLLKINLNKIIEQLSDLQWLINKTHKIKNLDKDNFLFDYSINKIKMVFHEVINEDLIKESDFKKPLEYFDVRNKELFNKIISLRSEINNELNSI